MLPPHSPLRGSVEALVEALLLRHHSQECGDGAALVFLPGVAEIERLAERLQSHAALYAVRLHSQLAPAEQRLAFQPAPRRGTTKVVLATDIAETSGTTHDVTFESTPEMTRDRTEIRSVTIDDVTLVIDGGLRRTPIKVSMT